MAICVVPENAMRDPGVDRRRSEPHLDGRQRRCFWRVFVIEAVIVVRAPAKCHFAGHVIDFACGANWALFRVRADAGHDLAFAVVENGHVPHGAAQRPNPHWKPLQVQLAALICPAFFTMQIAEFAIVNASQSLNCQLLQVQNVYDYGFYSASQEPFRKILCPGVTATGTEVSLRLSAGPFGPYS